MGFPLTTGRSLFPQIRLPVLVCVGRQSKVFPWQGSAYVGEHIAGAKTVFFEHSGHMPFYEEPEKFNQVVREFVLEPALKTQGGDLAYTLCPPGRVRAE